MQQQAEKEVRLQQQQAEEEARLQQQQAEEEYKNSTYLAPNLIGLTVSEAETVLQDLDCTLADYSIKYEFSESPKGTIISQDIAPNTELKMTYHPSFYVSVSKGTIDSYKSSAEIISYDDLYRLPESYRNTILKLDCIVSKIEKDDILGYTYSTVYWCVYNKETIIIYDERNLQEPTLKEGDHIVVYGLGNGLSKIDIKQKEYQGSLLIGFSYNATVDSYEVPCISAEYIEIK